MARLLLIACLLAALAASGCGGRDGTDGRQRADQPPRVLVYVNGFVERPGTYHVPPGTTVGEVIGLAGGLRPEADAAAVDQAEAVQATTQVYVPKRGEPTRHVTVPAPPAPATEAAGSFAPEKAPPATAKVFRGQPAVASAEEQQMLELVNRERTGRGLAPLALDAQLVKVARLKSQDMIDNDYFAHQSPRYGPVSALLASQGVSYRYAGENIAQTSGTVAYAHQSLMESPGHRRSILSPEFRRVGIGIIAAGGVITVTQVFTD